MSVAWWSVHDRPHYDEALVGFSLVETVCQTGYGHTAGFVVTSHCLVPLLPGNTEKQSSNLT